MKKVTRICPVCRTKYKADPVRIRHGRQTTCGRRCSYELRVRGQRRRVHLKCSVCRTRFHRADSQVKSKHDGVYCSRKCHYIGRARGLTRRVVTKPYKLVKVYDRKAAARKGVITRQTRTYHYSKAFREGCRQRAAQRISKTFRCVSKIEDEVAKELTRRGISFDRQIAIRNPTTGRFCGLVDFRLSPTLVLEINGTFWHADPRVFPHGPQFAAQRRTVSRYRRKLRFLKALGIKVIEIWETEIRQSVEHAVRNTLPRRVLC